MTFRKLLPIFAVLFVITTNYVSAQNTDTSSTTTESEYREVTISSFAKSIYSKIISGMKFTFSTVRQATGDIIKIETAPTPEPGVISALKKVSREQSIETTETKNSTSSTSTTIYNRSSNSAGGSSSGSSSSINSGSKNSPTTNRSTSSSISQPTPKITISTTPTTTIKVPNPTPSNVITPSISPSPTPTLNSNYLLPDTTLPTITINSPTNNSIVDNTVYISASAIDPQVSGQVTSGIKGVQFKLDNMNIGQEIITPPYSGNLSIAGIPSGTHSITASARDFAGNTRTSSPIYIVITEPVTTSTPSPTPTNTSIPANDPTPTPSPSSSPQAYSKMQVASVYETLRWIISKITIINSQNNPILHKK